MRKNLLFAAAAFCAALAMVSCQKDDSNTTTGGNGGNEGEGGLTIPLPEALTNGKDYYIITLGAEEYEMLEDEGKIKMDLQPYTIDVNGETKDGIGLYVWEGTYVGGTPSGLNSCGFGEGWVSFVVGTVGWTGGAYNLTTEGLADRKDLDLIKDLATGEYYLHLAYKTNQEGVAQLITLNWAEGNPSDKSSYAFAIGEGSIVQSDSAGQPVATLNAITPLDGEFNVGEWEEYEVKVSDMNMKWDVTPTSANFFQFSTSPATQGTTLDLDAVFFYQKN